MNNKLIVMACLAWALPVSAQETTQVYSDGQHYVVDIPYFELTTQAGKKAFEVLLKSPVTSDSLLFEVDFPPLSEVPLDECMPEQGETINIETARLYIEHNATDEDTGVHGSFDDHGWSKLCVYAPNGQQILEADPQGKLGDLTMAGIFFESREPPNDEYSITNLMADFPEGQYKVRGITFDGKALVGSAIFSHNIPAAPVITAPVLVEDEEDADDAVVETVNLTVTWEPVTESINGTPVMITGYEVIITKEVEDDPNGFSRPTFDVHVPAERTGLSVPMEFLEADTVYELEVLALEETGNQTISVGFFATK